MKWRKLTDSEAFAEIDHDEYCQKVCQGYKNCKKCEYFLSLKEKEVLDWK